MEESFVLQNSSMIFDLKMFVNQFTLFRSSLTVFKNRHRRGLCFLKFINDFRYEEVSQYTKCLNLLPIVSDLMENNSNNRPHCLGVVGGGL